MQSQAAKRHNLISILSLLVAAGALAWTGYQYWQLTNVPPPHIEPLPLGKPLDSFRAIDYNSGEWDRAKWLGVHMQQSPSDNQAMQELIATLKPDVIVETGTAWGGGTLFYATVLDQIKPSGKIATIDIDPRTADAEKFRVWKEHVVAFKGSSTDPAIVEQIKKMIKPNSVVLITLDSDHRKQHVVNELKIYAPLVTPGSYLVVQDTNVNGHPVRPDFGPGPMEAVNDFLKENHDFEVDHVREPFLTFYPDGWLKRKALQH